MQERLFFPFEQVINSRLCTHSCTYMFEESMDACSSNVRAGLADFGALFEPFPMPADDNTSQLMLFKSNRLSILSGYNETNATSTKADFWVFDTSLIWIFFWTIFALSSLSALRMTLLSKSLLRKKPKSLLRKVRKRFVLCLLAYYEASIAKIVTRSFMLKNRFVIWPFILLSFALGLLYTNCLNTSHVKFNEPRQVTSYEMIARYEIKPLFLGGMEDLKYIMDAREHQAEFIMKKVVLSRVRSEIIIDISNQSDVMALMGYLKGIIGRFPWQKEVLVVQEELIQLMKSMFCAFTLRDFPNLRLLSKVDPEASEFYAQIIFRKNFMQIKTGKRLYQAFYRLVSVSKVLEQVYKSLKSMTSTFYFLEAASPKERAVRERECAQNYVEVPDPSVDSVSEITPLLLYLMLAASLVALVVEITFRQSLDRCFMSLSRLNNTSPSEERGREIPFYPKSKPRSDLRRKHRVSRIYI